MRISDWSSDVCSSDLGAPAPTGDDAELIAERLRAGGYPAEDIDDGIDVLTPLIGHTLTVALPEGVRLADVPTSRRRAEMEFQFALAPTRVEDRKSTRLNSSH